MNEDFSNNLYGELMPKDEVDYKPGGFDNINFQPNPDKHKTQSDGFLPPHRMKSNFGSTSSGKVEVYNKVLNNIKKVYNIQKQVLYATELEKEKILEDNKKKNVPVNKMLEGS